MVGSVARAVARAGGGARAGGAGRRRALRRGGGGAGGTGARSVAFGVEMAAGAGY